MIAIYNGNVLNNNEAVLQNIIFEKTETQIFISYEQGTEDNIVLTYSIVPDLAFNEKGIKYNFVDESFNEIQTQFTGSKTVFYTLTVPKIACDFYIDIDFVNAEKTSSVTLTGDGSTVNFSANLLAHPVLGKTTVTYTISGTNYTVNDDENGNISDNNVTGKVDNENDTITLTFKTAPDNGTNITINYSYENKGNVSIALTNFVKHD